MDNDKMDGDTPMEDATAAAAASSAAAEEDAAAAAAAAVDLTGSVDVDATQGNAAAATADDDGIMKEAPNKVVVTASGEESTSAAAAAAGGSTETAAGAGAAGAGEKTSSSTTPSSKAKSIHLHGFADATPSPLKGAVPSFWAVGSGAGKLTSAAAAASAAGAATMGGVVGFGANPNSSSNNSQKSGEKGANEIVVTPAAGAIMAAISANAVTTATLTVQHDEEEEDAATDKIIQQMRDNGNDNNDGNNNNNQGGGDGNTNNDDPIDRAARAAAATLNRDALHSTYESNYATLQNERDDLRKQLLAKDRESNKQRDDNTKLTMEMEATKKQMEQSTKQREDMRSALQLETTRHDETQRQLGCATERIDRVERESDHLRKEIARLAQSNEEYNTLLTGMSSQHSKSSSEAFPLRLQVKRLEQELGAVQSHSDYLDGELASRNEIISSLKVAHSGELRILRGELTQAQLLLEQRERDLSSSRMMANQTSNEVERLQKKIYDDQMEYTASKELLEGDLNSERELVGLKEQRMLLAEDQRTSLLREVEGLKDLAREATEEAARQSDELQGRWNEGMEAAVREVREEEQRKREVLEGRLRVAEESKLRLEEDILNKASPPRRRIEGDSDAPLAITDGRGSNSLMMLDDSTDPLSLTDLYTRLASTEDELRSSHHENQKLKILIERIHRDVAAKTPIFNQKQLELENALEELDVAHDRLEYARREVTDIRSDNQDLELRLRQVERESGEFQRENRDLALQVQSLLQRRSGGDYVTFDDVASLQQQNQKLLRDHHSMLDKIHELENTIKNNPDGIELSQLRPEVDSLREEREKQTKLVAGIVHQRDLYRALVAKNDAPLIGGEGGGGGDNQQQHQLALVDARAEQLPLIEAKNADLKEEVSRLKAEVSVSKHENEALQARLARVDSHANELTTSNERLRGEFTTAKATAARLEIDVSHYQGKCDRLENSLEMIKAENASECKRRSQLEELLGKTQNHLDAVRGELAKKEQQYQQASSKMRLLEVQLGTSTANEKRMESEASSLRSEIARQETLLSSVQRIEASLTAKSEGELETLQEELKRVQESKSDDVAKHGEVVQKLEGKIADLELSLKELTAQKEEATVTAAKANLEVSKLKVNIQELTLKLKTSEKELTAAKVKLGDVTIDTSAEEVLEAKVATLTTELESAKSDLSTAQKRIADYQTIAKTAEEQVIELTAASTKYKDETTATLEKLRKSEQSQREAVAELTKDLMSHRDEKDKAVNELKAKIDSLKAQLAGSKDDSTKALANMESLTAEAKRYQLDAKNANVNYERELALHAEARTALRDTRSGMETEQRLREAAEMQLATANLEIEAERAAWQESKGKLEEALGEAKSRLGDMRSQNKLLHDQMTSLAATVEKFQSDKASQLVGGAPSGGDGDKADSSAADEKQLSDLRELLRFKQSECTMLEADLASAKRASERERTAAELAKRSLEESRSELKVLRDGDDAGNGGTGATEKETENLRSKIKGAEEQLVLLRESNTMLREESQKVTKKLSEVQSHFLSLKSSSAPTADKMKNMEVERASLEAEKDSLSREVDAWKKRVHSLVSKFNQIDPEEHAQTLAAVEKLKGECSSLKTQKDQAAANSTKAKNLVTRLNKEISSQKASIEAFKAALDKTKSEKEELTKTAKANKLTNKKIAEAQDATKKAEEELKKSKMEVAGLNSRVSNFKKMLQKMQLNLKGAKEAEDKAKATEESLQNEIDGLKQKLDTANEAAPPSADISPMDVAATSSEKPQVAKDVEKEAAPTPVVDKSNTQQQVNEAETQKASSTADPSSKPSAPDAAKTTVISKAKAQPEAKGEAVEKTTTDAAANKTEAKDAGADPTAVPTKKKGKKRKANTPKKNAAAESVVDSTKAPPQKKAATKSVAKKKEDPPSAGAPPAAKSTKAPPQKKPNTQSTPKKEIPAATAAADSAAESRKKLVAPASKKETPSDPATESAEALISLARAPTQKKFAKQSVAAAKKDPPVAASASKKEEEMKLKMLKKRQAAVLAKKLEAEKQLAAKKKEKAEASPQVPSNEGSDKSEKGSDASNISESKPKDLTVADKSESQAAPSTSSNKPLSPVPEQGGSNEAKEGTKRTATAAPGEKNSPASQGSAPKPLVFGSSATLTKPPTTFGVPKATPMQSEPDCPKPSFFGASTATTSAFGGSAAAAPAPFGGAATKPSEEGGLKASGSGAFLNLTPPGKPGIAQGKFVFGNSAKITLAVPSSSPMTAPPKSFASFGQTSKFGGGTPFGGGFGGAAKAATPFGSSPFGGGVGGENDARKRPLPTSVEKDVEPDAKQSRKEDGEIPDDSKEMDQAESSKTNKDAAAKEA